MDDCMKLLTIPSPRTQSKPVLPRHCERGENGADHQMKLIGIYGYKLLQETLYTEILRAI